MKINFPNEIAKNNDHILTLNGGLEGKFVFNTNDCIGKGNYGKIFTGRDMYTYEEVAIKMEHITSMELFKEHRNYRIIGTGQRFHNVHGFPTIYYLGNLGLKYTAMAMELLGPSLNELFIRCGCIFSLKTVLMIADQMITRIEFMHDCKLVHRDLKPENLAIGRTQQTLPYKESMENTIYLIDLGMAKEYVDPVSGMHIPFSRQAGVFGTYQFMSANSHENIEQSRKDDLEVLGYILLFFVNGTLPWIKYLENENSMDLDKCGEMKRTISIKNLCDGLPEEFAIYFDYVRKMDFFEEPDYERLRLMFYTLYKQNEFPEDHIFDWSAEAD
ncbi:Protein kinase domain,Protein kinase-like domain,Protein kinase, ATP binding site [Cinara cedri]|uniref:Protein kinase domain,Protein kinase-like domain,Protein kinase, ATP binding site n=1 Tax=Cinara cedri TaxID=506608 RepID=A0A5E4N398_9HEMI|nr:Protein kinase domain,Protein kinase-like domain,Protein kinase, ATP binding site [Cinara cedri]